MADWRVSGFTELQDLGAGGQGRVVLARHDSSGQIFAIKYVTDAYDLRSFRAEARTLAQVADPHVARLYDYVEHPGGGAAIIMEAVSGHSLKEHLAQHGRLTPEAALATLKGSLLGLAAAHSVDIVHRDYKPANVIVTQEGGSKLIDFGVATPAGAGGRSGTPDYMAPEQWTGSPATPATDVYAATCVFVECVGGRRPYVAQATGPGRLVELSERHQRAPIPVELVPEALRGLVERGLAKEPAARPLGARAFVAELEAAATREYGPDWERQGIEALAAAAAALAALFPLAMLAAQGSTAAAGSAGAAGSTASGLGQAGARIGLRMGGQGLRRTATKAAAGKVALAVAGTVAVGATGAAVYTVTTKHTPAKPPISTISAKPAAFTVDVQTRNSPKQGTTAAYSLQYVRVRGDSALAGRINAALRAPVDRAARDMNNMAQGTIVSSKATVGLHTSRLLSVSYDFGFTPSPGQTDANWVKNFTSATSVLIDLGAGATLGAKDVFTPSTLTPAGLPFLSDAIVASADPKSHAALCFNERGSASRPRFTTSDLTGDGGGPTVAMTFQPSTLDLDLQLGIDNHSMSCREVQTSVGYGWISNMFRPEFAALLKP